MARYLEAKHNGSWSLAKEIYVKSGGTYSTPVKEAYSKINGVWVLNWPNGGNLSEGDSTTYNAGWQESLDSANSGWTPWNTHRISSTYLNRGLAYITRMDANFTIRRRSGTDDDDFGKVDRRMGIRFFYRRDAEPKNTALQIGNLQEHGPYGGTYTTTGTSTANWNLGWNANRVIVGFRYRIIMTVGDDDGLHASTQGFQIYPITGEIQSQDSGKPFALTNFGSITETAESGEESNITAKVYGYGAYPSNNEFLRGFRIDHNFTRRDQNDWNSNRIRIAVRNRHQNGKIEYAG